MTSETDRPVLPLADTARPCEGNLRPLGKYGILSLDEALTLLGKKSLNDESFEDPEYREEKLFPLIRYNPLALQIVETWQRVKELPLRQKQGASTMFS